MKLKANLRMNRFQGGSMGHGVTIRIEDVISGCEVFEADLSMEAFGYLVSGLSKEVEADWQVQNLGKKREYKTEIVQVPKDTKDVFRFSDKQAREILAPYEIDGWEGDVGDLNNHHCRHRDGGQMVGFTRFVPMKEKHGKDPEK